MRTSPLLLSALLACSGETPDDSGAASTDGGAAETWSSTGAYGAGTVGFSVNVPGRDAPIPARAWYPTDPGGGTMPLHQLVQDSAEAAILADLVDAAPAGCPTTGHPAVEGATPAELEPSPLLVYSHCHACLGLSGAEVAATLASHGFVVVAPDHDGNTLFDLLNGDGGSLNEATLAQRAADASATLTAVIEGGVLPSGVTINADEIGAVGHSFGAVTVGRLLRDDDRVLAGLAMGAPIDNPLLLGVDAATVDEPVLLLLMEQDNSIGTLGNDLLAGNFDELAGPAWLATIPDAGHWSVSDLCGVVDDFGPGCGDDTRMTDGSDFSYISADVGRATAAQLSAAFFAHTLRGDVAATAWLDQPDTPAPVSVSAR